MIDIENELFTRHRDAIIAEYPKANVTAEFQRTPDVFPTASIVEADNSTYDKGADSSLDEKFASVMYEVNIYTNKASGKRQQAKRLLAIISDTFRKSGFRRQMSRPWRNQEDESVYRHTARFTAVVSDKDKIYRR